MPRHMDTPTFIVKAIEKWGEGKFGYDKCGHWKGAKIHFEIYCCKCEEYFLQTPDKHLQGTGCKKCRYELTSLNNPRRRDVEKFIEDARKVHRDKYDYSRVKNPTAKNKVTIGCPIHGWFDQNSQSHLQGCGCNDCGNASISQKQLMTTEECLGRFREAHVNNYEYPNFEYKGWDSKILAVCLTHGPWETTTAGSHIQGCGCPQCGNLKAHFSCTSTTEEFIAKAHILPGYKEKYDYTETDYTKAREKITIRCMLHDYRFEQTPNKHLCGEEGCHKCQKRGCSKKQLAWISYLEETTEGGTIHHKMNGGEFRIPGTRYHADGWRPDTHTVYEFHGTLWHGHPSHPDYIEDEPHPVISKKTWGQVYQNTLKKEQKIRELGFNLVVMWEHVWDYHAPKPKAP
jgi:hypothetical protein